MFPNLYRLFEQKGVVIADLWDVSSREGIRNTVFEMLLNDWELEETDFFETDQYEKDHLKGGGFPFLQGGQKWNLISPRLCYFIKRKFKLSSSI